MRDTDKARRFLLQGWWCQRVTAPRPSHLRAVLEWTLEIASAGQALPPPGFLADLGHLAFTPENAAPSPRDVLPAPALPVGLLRTYEDHVLGKLYGDGAFGRACDALRRYQGRDRARGLAFVVKRFAARSDFAGVPINPGVIKAALDAPADEIHARGWESLGREGLQAVLVSQYEELIAAARRIGDVLGSEDISQLERGTALRPEGEQLAERQVLQAANVLESTLPRHRFRPRVRHREVPTHLLDEDVYPVGGFASLSTRGSVESLLHSQLAYMETDERPDLFDIKFLRDELLYYARDENQFLRRRRTFVFVLYPDLDQTRFKDRGLEFQRGVLLLGLLCAAVRKLSEWLRADALAFRIVFIRGPEGDSLAPERALLESLWIDETANGSVQLMQLSEDESERCRADWARRSLCHTLRIDVRPCPPHADDAMVHDLTITGPRPMLADAKGECIVPEEGDPLESWSAVLQELLQRLV